MCYVSSATTLIGVMHTRVYVYTHYVDDKLDKTSLLPLVKREYAASEFVRLIAACTKSYVIATDSSMLLTLVPR